MSEYAEPGAARSQARRIRAWLAGLCLAAISSVACAAGVEVRTLDGKNSTLADQVRSGHYTVVMMWTTYCHVCKGEYPELSAFHDAHVGKDAEVVGISLDGYAEIDKVRQFVAGRPFTYPTVLAEADRMASMFEAATGDRFTGTPTYLVFNPQRQLVAARSGDLTRDVLENFLRKQSTPQP
jgi:thiol-disulfide isomerase/thioredoxin